MSEDLIHLSYPSDATYFRSCYLIVRVADIELGRVVVLER